MAIFIPPGLTDDNDFIQLLNTILNNLLKKHEPERFWVIQIDNWFDHKWLKFSGTGATPLFPSHGSAVLGFPLNMFESTKREFHKEALTFPPFAPERVLCQWSFQRSGDTYTELPLPDLPHDLKRRRSASNLNRRIQRFDQAAMFVWFSNNTLKNGRGSLMVYSVDPSHPVSWFASFRREESWILERAKGVHLDLIANLMTIN